MKETKNGVRKFSVLIMVSVIMLIISATIMLFAEAKSNDINESNISVNVLNGSVDMGQSTTDYRPTGSLSLITPTSTPTPTREKYSAIFGKSVPCCFRNIGNGANNWSEIANYTFYLPVSSYVYIESGGSILNFNKHAAISMTVDVTGGGNTDTYRMYGNYFQVCNGFCETGFQTSKVYKLNIGYHTVRLYGWTDVVPNTYVSGVVINVMANERGSEQTIS